MIDGSFWRWWHKLLAGMKGLTIVINMRFKMLCFPFKICSHILICRNGIFRPFADLLLWTGLKPCFNQEISFFSSIIYTNNNIFTIWFWGGHFMDTCELLFFIKCNCQAITICYVTFFLCYLKWSLSSAIFCLTRRLTILWFLN